MFYLAPCFFHLAVCHGIYSTVVHRKHFFFFPQQDFSPLYEFIQIQMEDSTKRFGTSRRVELSFSVMGKTAKETGFGGSIKILFG